MAKKAHIKKASKIQPKSFRFTNEDLEIFKDISFKINKQAKSPVNDTKVMQALLRLGGAADPETLIYHVKELI